ncbi:MAG TPA: tRNA glutamyl-Q(34) synthetase GluQRS [Candidatus Limnocylindrales bacterium]|nr:tRNA glutamyl-Q(34) synthetase GluQRS [Candidatus Limnocylindrales bacterium]
MDTGASAVRLYRGRIAPSPTGFLHLGHARTFWVAYRRARAAAGRLVFRNEDLDYQRCKPEFVQAMYEDLRWLGLDWDEGPDAGGDFGPYSQSRRRSFYLAAWRILRDRGFIYPCTCSRKDLEQSLSAPHEDDDEIHYPGACRTKLPQAREWETPAGVSWRFKVPDGRPVAFNDLNFGPQSFTAGPDFSDFLVWRRDDIPSYQLAVVVDDEAMRITEVVRGADLLRSTARQLLLIEALHYSTPSYFHCPLLRDEKNVRLAKRHDAMSLRRLREEGVDPGSLLEAFSREIAWDRNPVSGTQK